MGLRTSRTLGRCMLPSADGKSPLGGGGCCVRVAALGGTRRFKFEIGYLLLAVEIKSKNRSSQVGDWTEQRGRYIMHTYI